MGSTREETEAQLKLMMMERRHARQGGLFAAMVAALPTARNMASCLLLVTLCFFAAFVASMLGAEMKNHG